MLANKIIRYTKFDLRIFVTLQCNLLVTKLSVNINKIATLRNARGGNIPDLIKTAKDIERFGADGITVHPRPDERHIRYTDVEELTNQLKTEFNIEGNPREHAFIEVVMRNRPTQVTLVPDNRGQLTSNHGWDTIKHQSYLKEVITELKKAEIRTSIFIDADCKHIEAAASTGADRVELYTENYAREYSINREAAILPYLNAAACAVNCGLGLNAGHDLNLQNLKFFSSCIPTLDEVSIGHALIADALYYGLENTVQLYKRCLIHF